MWLGKAMIKLGIILVLVYTAVGLWGWVLQCVR